MSVSAFPRPFPETRATRLFRLAIGNYFMGGFLLSLISLLVPRLKLLLGLDYAQAAMVQFAFHSSYLLFAVPVTLLLVHIGYMRGITLGLAIMAASCGAFTMATGAGSYPGVLLALLALAGGITFLQIAGNIVVAVVEPVGRAISRMTLLQGFNSIGTVIGPLVGAQFFLATSGAATAHWWWLAVPFLFALVVLAALAITHGRARDLLHDLPPPRRVALWPPHRGLFCDVKLMAGVATMFAYVGAEVTIGSLLTSYMVLPEVLGVTPLTAGRLVSLYWGGAMIGRFVGAFLLARYPAPRLLLAAGLGAALLILVAIGADGVAGAMALLAVGLCNAIMYPTIFALALPADEGAAPYASMLLCMAVVGGAVIPLLTGIIADATTLQTGFLLAVGCYLGIAGFARLCLHIGGRSVMVTA